MSSERDRAVGSVMGLAVGDALGAPTRFRRAHEVTATALAPASTGTAATAMARNLWLSLTATGGDLDTGDVLTRHLGWLETSPPDLDTLTRRVLAWAAEGVWDPAHRYLQERGPELGAGNGSVGYCAPLGVAYAHRPGALTEAAPALSSITHWDERCRTACLAVALTTAALVRGEPPERSVRAALAAIEHRVGGEELEYLVGGAGIERPIDGPDREFVFFAAGVALRVAGEARGFEEGLRSTAALGGDTSTNAAVAGALLGALHGVDAVPPGWFSALAEGQALRREAEAFAAVAAGRG